ncbi:Crp/Fnr family transcriptional regulator [Sphingomonas sp. Y38-1Y]|uniref:Crp/Fnr family transcriptional regulator n=1 Tax=Sphingomonas sp. Y38-1Y TaxID=3078265 RepID=UPI0028EED680|nr:Crp/Fnr family transcriptional regulator [Sphingomonas sp. Y38-1Y]
MYRTEHRIDRTDRVDGVSFANAFLAGLSRDDARAVAATAMRVTLASGDPAVPEGQQASLWLPETAVLSFGEALGGRLIECGIIGREGLVGWEPATGIAPSAAIGVLIRGTALVVPGERVSALCAERPTLAAALLRYRETLVAQMRATIAARLHCRPEARLARWLCMLHDRVEGDTLDITHLRLADFLASRRAGVTDSLHLLEGERVLRCTRGKIVVRSRAALEQAAGECYGAAERVHRALVGPFGKVAAAA